jgi:hypothetical protein
MRHARLAAGLVRQRARMTAMHRIGRAEEKTSPFLASRRCWSRPGLHSHRIIHRDHRGVLVHPVLVAALKQQLLERNRPRLDHQCADACTQAATIQGSRIDRTDFRNGPPRCQTASVRTGCAVVRGDKISGVPVVPVDVLHEPVDQRFVDGVTSQNPAMVNEMRNIVALGRRQPPAGGLPGKKFHRIGAVGPEDLERSIAR